MKTILSIFLIAAAVFVQAQTTHNVTVLNNSFSPANLSIQVGDTVRWTNNSGSHNVNGTTSTFPSNPESFGNSVGTNWVYTHVFMTAGEYDYQCNPHAAMGMKGEITVTPISSVNEAGAFQATVFPNPAHDFVLFEFGQDFKPGSTLFVFDMAGKEMTRFPISGMSARLETGSWSGGVYLFQVIEGKSLLAAGQVIIQH